MSYKKLFISTFIFILLSNCSYYFEEKEPLLIPPIAKDEIPIKVYHKHHTRRRMKKRIAKHSKIEEKTNSNVTNKEN